MGERTGSNSLTIHQEGNERVYPCRCGAIHQGEYGAHDWAHHNCLHEDLLVGLGTCKDSMQVVCPLCGESWIIDVKEKK